MNQLPKKRVLMIVENKWFPQDVRVRQEALALSEAGYLVSVIAPAKHGQLWRERYQNINIFRFPASPSGKGFLSYIFEYTYSFLAIFLLSLVVWFHPGFDVIHAANPPDIIVFVALVHKIFRKHFIFDHHDLAPELYYAKFAGKRSKLIFNILIFFERLSCRSANHIIATNESYKNIDIKRSQIPANRITVVRNGPDIEKTMRITPLAGLRDESKIRLVYVGEMGFQDGVDKLLHVLKQLIDDLNKTNFQCILVGDGDALGFLKQLCEQLNLANYVTFVGWVEQNQVPNYLDLADICVAPEPSNPYNNASTMIKIMEYMAMGKPIVAFDLPEHRVTAGKAALYAHSNDELQYALLIQKLMDHPDLRQKMGQFGKDRIKNGLSWTHQKQRLVEAYSIIHNLTQK